MLAPRTDSFFIYDYEMLYAPARETTTRCAGRSLQVRAGQWVRERAIPLPPRCRSEVNSSHLPASPFRAPGDAMTIAPFGEWLRLLRRGGPQVEQEQ